MARGGRRTGAAGTSYTNRADLNQNRGALPIKAAPSSQYGQGVTLKNAQQAVPMGAQPQPGLPQNAGLAGTPTPPPVVDAPPPGSHGDFMRPTERPDEPLTAGLPFGPGPGPATPAPQISPLTSTLAALNTLGPNVSPLVKAVRSQANAMAQVGIT